MRSREMRTISSGLIRFLRSASRSSATVLASTPALRAPLAAVLAAPLAALPAFCWRARALPPLLAAALREAALRVEEDLLAEEALRPEDGFLAEEALRPEDDLLAEDFARVDDRAFELDLLDLPPLPPLPFCAMPLPP